MKKCDQFKDLILTDYMDAEAGQELSGGLESHLQDCADCRAFYKEVRNNAVLPFAGLPQQPVPAQLWENIREKLERQGQAAEGPLEEFIENLKGWLIWPRLVPVLASFILIFLAGSVTLNTMRLQQAKDKEQGEYLSSLLEPTGPLALNDNNDGKTAIEHYFL